MMRCTKSRGLAAAGVALAVATPAGCNNASDGVAARGVAAILDVEPGSSAQHGVLTQVGRSEAGGAAGRFALSADLASGRHRLTIRSGGVSDEDGWDGTAWSAHDGAVEQVDLPGAAVDVGAESFLRRYGWRNRASRAWMRPAGRRTVSGRVEDGIAVAPPGAAPLRLWFDAVDHRLGEAVVDADMGPLSIRFADWRQVGGAAYAFRRERRDATGQTTLLVTERTMRRAGLAPRRPCEIVRGQLTAPTSVPFVLDHGTRGHIVIAVDLNGRPGRLVFDTGAANYLTPAAARHLGLRIDGGLAVGGVGESSFSGGFARLRSLRVGQALLVDTSAIVAPLPDAAVHPRPGLELEGLTGAELLHAFRTTIDYGASTLSFAPFASAHALPGASLRYASDGQALFVEASVNGRTGWFRLDTGDSGSVSMFAAFARGLGLGGSAATSRSEEAGGALSMAAATFDRVEVAGNTFRAVPGEISAQQAGAFASRSIAGNLGSSILSCFRLTVDRHARRISFDRLRSGNEPPACLATR